MIKQQIKLTDRFWLLEHAGPKPVVKQNTTHNHVWLFDRSGSMTNTIHGLVDDMVQQLDLLPNGDFLTLGWFSGEGQSAFIISGHRLEASSRPVIVGQLRKYASTVGTTCFSEILGQTAPLMDTLNEFDPLTNLVFFTDGHPVVNNYAAEVSKITSALHALRSRVAAAVLIGYGPYYNKELMAEMAEILGATFIHSSSLTDYNTATRQFLTDAAEIGGRRISVQLPANHSPYPCFSLNGDSLVVYAPDTEGVFYYAPPRRGRNSFWSITTEPQTDLECSTLLDSADPKDLDAGVLRAVYGAALMLSQRTKVDAAMEILNALGDAALVNRLVNAFTNDEYGAAESNIRQAIRSPKGRWTAGYSRALPKRDAYCLVDLMDMLTDDGALFLPGHPAFQYRRIGVKTTPKAGAPVFKTNDLAAIPIDTLTWNDSKLNLSVTCRLPGTVKLDENAEKFGFAANYPTYKWRSYSLVRDGNYNVNQLPVLVKPATANCLVDSNLANRGKWPAEDGRVPVIIDLTKLPVMNRQMADNMTSAKALGQLAVDELVLENRCYALGVFIRQLEEAGAEPVTPSPLTPNQLEYLAKFHIGVNGFQPPAEAEEPTDSYVAKEFTIKIASFSGAADPLEVEEKKKLIESGKGGRKKITPKDELMLETLQWIDSTCGRTTLNRLRLELAEQRRALRSLRRRIQRIKFAILLGKRWFDEFSSREENTVNVSLGNRTLEVSFKLREVAVPISA